MKVPEMKLFIIFFVILRHAFAFSLKGGDWFLKSTLAIGDCVTLQCPFTRLVNCQWQIGYQMMPTSMRYRYFTGNGSNTTDCSIRIINSKEADVHFWTCEIYKLSDDKNPIATLRHYLTKDIYKVHALVEIQNLERHKMYRGTSTMCASNTYVDRCFYIINFFYSHNHLPETGAQPARVDNCLRIYGIGVYANAVCGLEKDVYEPRFINGKF